MFNNHCFTSGSDQLRYNCKMADTVGASDETAKQNCEETVSTMNVMETCKSDEVVDKKTHGEGITTNGTPRMCSPCDKSGCSIKPSLLSVSGVSGFGSSCGISSLKNRFTLQSSVFSPIKNTDKNFGTKSVVLRPSQLSGATATSPLNSSSSFLLNPPKLTTVANLQPCLDKEQQQMGDKTVNKSSTSPCSSSLNSQITVPCSMTTTTTCGSASVSFVPLSTSSSSSVVTTSAPPTIPVISNFVFGQNLHERVADAATSNEGVPKANGATSEMLFSSVLQRELSDRNSDSGGEEREKKSLSEAAREYEESRAVKRKYEEVAVITGEEEECNVLQMNCKLFAFDNVNSTWVERGRGTLRVNDMPVGTKTQSRVIMRTVGSLRVVLNTKIWAGMSVDKPSTKSVRLTAMDSSGQIRVFLVMAGSKEIDQLYKTLDWRVTNQKKLSAVTNVNSDCASVDKINQ